MRTLVTGATGMIGSQIVRGLLSQGKSVRVLSRAPEAATRALGNVEAIAWDPTRPVAPEALASCATVVHLAGESVAGRWTPARKEAIERSRVEGTRALVQAIERLPAELRPSCLVSASAIGYYGDTGERETPESAPSGSDFLARVCVNWEREAMRAAELGVRVVTVRIGLVLSMRGGALERMLPLFRAGMGGRLGPGSQWWPWVHEADVVGIFDRACTDETWQGAVNATAPEPVRQRDFASACGRVLHRPAFLPAPAFALRAALGEFSVELLASRRVVPTRTESLGFAFLHPRLEPALTDLIRG